MPIGPFAVWLDAHTLQNKMADSPAIAVLAKILFIRRMTDGQMFCEQLAQATVPQRTTAPTKCPMIIVWYRARFLVMI